MVWSAIERVSVQAIQFILGIILARILTPEEYGIIGILFALLMQFQRKTVHEMNPEMIAELIENEAFRATINWFPWYGLLLTTLTVFYALKLLRNTRIHKEIQ